VKEREREKDTEGGLRMHGDVRISARKGHTHSPFVYVYERIRVFIQVHVHGESTHSRCRVRNKDKSREDKKIKYTQRGERGEVK